MPVLVPVVFKWLLANWKLVLVGLLVAALGVQTLRLSGADATISRMETAHAKEIADALALELKYKDADRKNNERVEASYQKAKDDLDAANARTASALALAAHSSVCIATDSARALTDGLRDRSQTPTVPARNAASPAR